MTEVEWLACGDPSRMLAGVGEVAGNRKLRLFAVACCYFVWDCLDGPARALLPLAERYCDGLGVSKAKLKGERRRQPEVALRLGSAERYLRRAVRAAAAVDLSEPHQAYSVQQAQEAAFSAALALVPDEFRGRDAIDLDQRPEWRAARSAQAVLALDIFGNPFRPVTFAPEWRTDTARALAAQMYESRDFSAMPILADALQDAGCDNPDTLGHCRGPGPHVRGCWVVDMVIGKE